MYTLPSLPMLAIVLAVAKAVTATNWGKDGFTIYSDFDETTCGNEGNGPDWNYPRNILHLDWSLFAASDESKRWDLSEFRSAHMTVATPPAER